METLENQDTGNQLNLTGSQIEVINISDSETSDSEINDSEFNTSFQIKSEFIGKQFISGFDNSALPVYHDSQSSSKYSTGKSLSEALVFAPINPQYDDRLFIELQVQYMKTGLHENSKLKPWENMLCTEIVSDIQNNFCTQQVMQKEELLTKIYLY